MNWKHEPRYRKPPLYIPNMMQWSEESRHACPLDWHCPQSWSAASPNIQHVKSEIMNYMWCHRPAPGSYFLPLHTERSHHQPLVTIYFPLKRLYNIGCSALKNIKITSSIILGSSASENCKNLGSEIIVEEKYVKCLVHERILK